MIHGGNVWQGNGPAQWLDYSANIRPEGAPEWVKEALLQAMDFLSYYPDPDMKEAGEALAQFLHMPPSFVRPTAGGISALDMTTYLPVKQAAQFTPCFVEYSMLNANRARPMRNIPLMTGGRAIGDPAEQAKDVLQEKCAVWLCNPLNPVGCAFSKEQISRLLSLVEEKNGYLIVDEAFIDYCPQKSVVSLIETHERLLVAGSMTKILGVPGVRIGYLCAQPHVLQMLAPYQLTWELNCFAHCVLKALPVHAEQVRADGEANAARREWLKREMEQTGIYVYPSESAFLLADMAMPAAPVAAKLKERGVLVRECMNFDGIADGRHLRFAVKHQEANERLIKTLREVLTCAENL